MTDPRESTPAAQIFFCTDFSSGKTRMNVSIDPPRRALRLEHIVETSRDVQNVSHFSN
jgi:hypothetical protein